VILFGKSEILRCVFGKVCSQEFLRFRKRQMEIIQSVQTNAKILAAAFKYMTSIQTVFRKKVKVVPRYIQGA
jgi:hypothetical protein